MSTAVLDKAPLYSLQDDAIDALRAEYMQLEVTDVNDKQQLATVRKARLHVREIRIEVEKKRKELGEEALRHKQRVDSEAKRIKELLEPMESHLQAEEDKPRIEAERVAKEAEAKRVALVAERVKLLDECGYRGSSIGLDVMPEEEFAQRLAEMRKAIAEEQAQAAREAEERRVEAERLAAEREELARQRAAQEAEQARQAAEQKRIDDERAAVEAEAAKLRHEQELAKARAEAAEKAAREERERAEREAAAEKERQAREAESRRRAVLRSRMEALYEVDSRLTADEVGPLSETDYVTVLRTEQLAHQKRVAEAEAAEARARAEREAAEAKHRAEMEAAIEKARIEQEAAEAKAKAEAEEAERIRREAAKPDADKLLAFAEVIRALETPSLTEANQNNYSDVRNAVESLANYVKEIGADIAAGRP